MGDEGAVFVRACADEREGDWGVVTRVVRDGDRGDMWRMNGEVRFGSVCVEPIELVGGACVVGPSVHITPNNPEGMRVEDFPPSVPEGRREGGP